ncbi:MAG TPA: HAMP domain-containing sensor histidine kinase [Anaerolineales bacterium]|nr:HAMP domain-containing sensor histidine kinase [Anaerolineales bacterium]
MKLTRWLVTAAPGVIGVGLALYFFLSYDARHDHIVYLRADLGTLSLLFGLGLSVLALLGYALLDWAEKTRQQAANAAAEERRRFLRRLDHELKNPLTAIRAGLANLTESPSDEARREALTSVEAQTLRLSRLSADLRKLAELEVRLVEHSPVDVPALLHEAFSMAQEQPGAAERHLNLSIPQAPWPLPHIQGDPDLLLLAIHNLLDNALKFSRPGDTLELRAFEDGAEIVIEVADTGPGIPEDEQPHVWEELYRGVAGRGIPGSGLGLALVRAIAERHAGRVSLRSRLSQGTVFTLRLPAGRAQSSVTEQTQPVSKT